MHKRLMEFLDNFQKLPLLNFIEDIEKAIDNKSFVWGLFIDIQKAFDTVDHNILAHKIHHYGIRDLANNYFSCYVSNRKLFVSINEFIFSTTQSQGSVFGLFLFNLRKRSS